MLPTPGLPLLISNPEVLVHSPDLSARPWHSAVRQYKAGSRELPFRACPGDFREHWLPEAAATSLPPLLGLTVPSANLHSIAMSCTVSRKQHSVLGESPGHFRCSKHKVPKLNRQLEDIITLKKLAAEYTNPRPAQTVVPTPGCFCNFLFAFSDKN